MAITQAVGSTQSQMVKKYGASWLARLKTASPGFQKVAYARMAYTESGQDWRGKPGTEIANELTGALRKVEPVTLEDSTPLASGKKGSDAGMKAPAISSDEGILEKVKSGLTSYLPLILVIGAVIVGVVIIKSAGSK